MNIKLIIIGGKKAGTEIPIAVEKFLIGRDGGCQLRLQSNLVDGKHCEISIGNRLVSIKDFSSASGTFVNGEKIRGHSELNGGDRIKVGELEMEFRLEADAEEKQQPPHGAWEIAARTQGINGGAVFDGVAAASAASGQRATKTRTRKVKREYDGVDLLLLASIPLLLVLVLGLLFPGEARWGGISHTLSSIFTPIGAWWTDLRGWCRRIWVMAVWPWWVWAGILVIPVSALIVLMKIQARLQR